MGNRSGAIRRAIAAITGTAAELYGHGDCASTPEPNCWDLNRSVVASGIEIPPMEFQNRPTFQQTVSIKHPVP